MTVRMKKNIVISSLTWQPAPEKAPVLQEVTLELEPGNIYGIIGPNGAGKTSLLRHILGFLRERGAVTLGARAIEGYSAKELARELAFVPQRTDIDTDFTAKEVVMTGRNPYQKRFAGESAADRDAVAEALATTGSSHLAQQPFAQLSGGEAQKIIVARAIAQDTPWMLLDEPVASLDIRNQVEILENLKKQNQKTGLSVLMILHDVNLAAAYCHRLIMLKNGRVLRCGQTDGCLTRESLKELYDIEFSCVRGDEGRVWYYPRL